MKVRIKKGVAAGRVDIPASKSLVHRALVNAALCDGESTICSVPLNDDITATINCLRALGADIVSDKNGNCRVSGIKNTRDTDCRILDCGESASTLRFLIPVALSDGIKTLFRGSESLMDRPLTVYRDICKKYGFLWEESENSIAVRGKLVPDVYPFAGYISSQFTSGLIFALSTLKKSSKILLIGQVHSSAYINLTVESCAAFGVEISRVTPNEIYIGGNQRRHPVRDLKIEGDESAAAIFGAFNATGGNVVIDGLNEKSHQADAAWKTMFVRLKESNPVFSLRGCPDLAPLLMVTGALCHGVTLTDTQGLAYKESRRARAMATEMRKCGIRVVVNPNDIAVLPAEPLTPLEPLSGHGDHRVVMSLAVLLSAVGGEISEAEAVSKSMPDFWNILRGLGIDAEPRP